MMCKLAFLFCLRPDIDECEAGIHNCGEQFTCQNTQGSFRCAPKNTCGSGFIQDALGSCIGETVVLQRAFLAGELLDRTMAYQGQKTEKF